MLDALLVHVVLYVLDILLEMLHHDVPPRHLYLPAGLYTHHNYLSLSHS